MRDTRMALTISSGKNLSKKVNLLFPKGLYLSTVYKSLTCCCAPMTTVAIRKLNVVLFQPNLLPNPAHFVRSKYQMGFTENRLVSACTEFLEQLVLVQRSVPAG